MYAAYLRVLYCPTQGDCISIAVHSPNIDADELREGGATVATAASSSHVYMTDYDRTMPQSDTTSWLQAVSGGVEAVRDATKYFVVADAATGRLLLNVSIAPREGAQASVIVPGAHNDVFIGTRLGLLRIYV